MCYANIFVVYIFFGIISKYAECAVLYQWYDFDSSWEILIEDKAATNIWCENKCKAADINYRFSGTISKYCYCQKAVPSKNGNRTPTYCTEQCPGNISEICGGYLNTHDFIITVSEIERSTETVTVGNTQTTSATSLSIRESTTAVFRDMITTNTYPETVTKSTPFTIRELFSTTENKKNAISTVITETSTQATTGKRSIKLLCKCPKRFINTKWHFLDGLNMTDSELMKIIIEDFYQNVLSEITVDKKTVTKEVRKKNSAVNKTKSAQFIGWGCVVFLIFPIVIVITLDLLNCCFHHQTRSRCSNHCKRNRINAISDTNHHGDSDMPLQENVGSTEDYYASGSDNNFHPGEMKRETYHRRQEDHY